MVINEIFYSIQGEGLLAGVPSIFIRLAGCTVGCDWCDTKYAWDPNAGDDLSIGQIIDKVDNLKHLPPSTQRPQRKNVKVWSKSRYVVLTGGEPMVNEQLPELADALKKLDKHVTIETAGVEFIPDVACDLMSISPKTSNSGQTQKGSDPFFDIRELIEHYPYQLKFVVDTPDDLPEIRQVVKELGNVDPARVMLMPQAKTRDELIAKSPMAAELCKQTGYTFCNRLQILLYDGQRGK
jgi:7-carboxy-7-deazaguanine synthase